MSNAEPQPAAELNPAPAGAVPPLLPRRAGRVGRIGLVCSLLGLSAVAALCVFRPG